MRLPAHRNGDENAYHKEANAQVFRDFIEAVFEGRLALERRCHLPPDGATKAFGLRLLDGYDEDKANAQKHLNDTQQDKDGVQMYVPPSNDDGPNFFLLAREAHSADRALPVAHTA